MRTSRGTMKRQFADCLKELMKERTIDKITIQDLTSTLNVNRQTFYYHFEDIYSLLNWTLQEEAVQLLQNKEKETLWNEGLLALFQYFEDNKAFSLSTIKSLGAEKFKQFFYGEFYEIINAVIVEVGKDIKAEPHYMEFLSHFYTISLPTTAISFIQGEMDNTVEEIVEMIDKTLRDQIYGAKFRNE